MSVTVSDSAYTVTVSGDGKTVAVAAPGLPLAAAQAYADTVSAAAQAAATTAAAAHSDAADTALQATLQTYANTVAAAAQAAATVTAEAYTDVTAALAGHVYLDAKQGANPVVWDGVTNDTTALTAKANAALAAGLPLLLPAGTGMVGTWTPPSGLTIQGAAGGTTLKQHSSATGTSAVVMDLTGASNITIRDVTIDGNLSAFSGVVTEHKHGVQVNGGTNIRLVNVKVTGCKGDGFYVGRNGSTHSSRIRMFGCSSTGNYRNNLSVVDCRWGRFASCDFPTASGTAPQTGVDVEPNTNADAVSDILFVDCTMDGNSGYGFASTQFQGGQVQERVQLVSCTMNGNGLQGVYLYGTTGTVFVGCSIDGNTLDGVSFANGAIQDTLFVGGSITRNGHHGIQCQPPTGATVKNTVLLGVNIYDNGVGAAAGTYYGAVWGLDSNGGTINGLTVIGCTSTNRATASQKYGMYHSALVSNLTETDNDFVGNATAAAIYNDDATTRRAARNRGVTEVSGIATTGQTLAGNVKFASVTPSATPGNPITLTLPLAPEPITDYTIWDAAGNAGTNNITIAPAAGHAYGNVASLVLSTNFQLVRLVFRSNKWFVVAKTP